MQWINSTVLISHLFILNTFFLQTVGNIYSNIPIFYFSIKVISQYFRKFKSSLILHKDYYLGFH